MNDNLIKGKLTEFPRKEVRMKRVEMINLKK